MYSVNLPIVREGRIKLTQSLYFWGPMLAVLVIAGGVFYHFFLSTANSLIHNVLYSESEILILEKSNETKKGGLISYFIHGHIKYMRVDKENFNKVETGDSATLKDSTFSAKMLTVKRKNSPDSKIYRIKLKTVTEGKMVFYLKPLNVINEDEYINSICKEVSKEEYIPLNEGDLIKINSEGSIIKAYKVI